MEKFLGQVLRVANYYLKVIIFLWVVAVVLIWLGVIK